MTQQDLIAQRLSLALAAARLGDFHWDRERDQIVFSARAAEIIDISPGRTLTRLEARQLVHSDDRAAVAAALDTAVGERGEYSIDHRILVGDCERWVSASGRTLIDDHGQVTGVVGVLQDITAHRFLMAVDDAVRALIDPEQITYAAARLLGLHLRVDRCAYAFVEADQDTFILTGNYTRAVHSIVGRYRFRQFGAECLRLMRAGLPYVVRDSASDPRLDEDDRKAYEATAICGVICVPINKAGRFVGAMAVHSATPREWHRAEVDLVQQVASRCWESIERAKIEAERQRLLDAAEAANRAKDEFLAMLGHELRNPLAPIRTAVQLMKLRDPQALKQERTVIERQVNHLTLLVDDLLDVARIARGLVELKREPIELGEIVARALEIARPLLEQRAHLIAVVGPMQGLCVEGDVQRLTQVVTNLLTNAAKYTPPGGKIEVVSNREGAEVVLRVRDTGIGMTAEVLEHAFELFMQGRQGVDRRQGGLGLGLSIVRNLVQRHGGSVAAASAGPGQGSELTVRLPRLDLELAPRPAGALAVERASAPIISEARVLVVDDNEDAANLLASALSDRGCDVRVAHDAAAALSMANERAFDVALLDIGLPVMDGYELAGRLRQLEHFSRASLVAVTGYGQTSDRQRALESGFHEHLVKPVDLAVLERIIAQARADERLVS